MSIARLQRSDSDTIDLPHDVIAGPINGVCVESPLVVWTRVKGSSVVSGRLALAEIVALNLSVVATQPFPVNLVEVVGLQDGTADDTRTWRRLHHELHTTKHDVEV